MMKQSGQTKKIIGIDYSLTSPAICIADESFDFSKCEFYYLTSKKKHLGKVYKNITGDEHKEYNDPIERFTNISDWVFKSIHTLSNVHQGMEIYIEGYSYGSKGQAIFQIAENCGILKHRLSERKLTYGIVVPSVVKKMATGKGNADKEKMYEQFTKDTKIDLKKVFDMNKLNNPVTDIIDSYYIAKSGYENNSI